MVLTINEILPDELSKRHDVMEKIINVFKENKYSRITTPTFEPYSELSRGWGKYLKEESIKFINEQGEVMVLRPEMTTPIARLVASRNQEISFPQKLFYLENVFRKKHILRKQEFVQIGAEFLGESSIETDTHIINLCIDVLKSAGVKDFKIEVGHFENYKNESPAIQDSLMNMEYHKLSQKPVIGYSDVLSKDSYLYSFDKIFKNRHAENYQHIIYNLGLAERVSYYTGITFNILIEGVGFIVGSGGRYDSLYKDYSYDIPAIGFAIGFEKLITYFKEME
jgi:ATP phosphoribosyltransferase regulatory subunit